MAAMMRSLSSCLEATRMWRKTALTHHGRQSVHAFAEVDRPHRYQRAHCARRNDHDIALIAHSTFCSVATSTPGATRTVVAPITISIAGMPEPLDGCTTPARDGAPSTITDEIG